MLFPAGLDAHHKCIPSFSLFCILLFCLANFLRHIPFLFQAVGIAANVFRRLMAFGEKFGLLKGEKCLFKTLCAEYFSKNVEDLSNDDISLFCDHVIASHKSNPMYVSIVRLARPFVRDVWRQIIAKAHHSSNRRGFGEDAYGDSDGEETQQSMYEADGSGVIENDTDTLSDDNPSASLSATSPITPKTSASTTNVAGGEKVNSLALWRTMLAGEVSVFATFSLINPSSQKGTSTWQLILANSFMVNMSLISTYR